MYLEQKQIYLIFSSGTIPAVYFLSTTIHVVYKKLYIWFKICKVFKYAYHTSGTARAGPDSRNYAAAGRGRGQGAGMRKFSGNDTGGTSNREHADQEAVRTGSRLFVDNSCERERAHALSNKCGKYMLFCGLVVGTIGTQTRARAWIVGKFRFVGSGSKNSLSDNTITRILRFRYTA